MFLWLDSDSTGVDFTNKSRLSVTPSLAICTGSRDFVQLHNVALKNVNTSTHAFVYLCCSLVKPSIFNDSFRPVIALIPISDKNFVTQHKPAPIYWPLWPGLHQKIEVWLEDSKGNAVTCDRLAVGFHLNLRPQSIKDYDSIEQN